MSEAENQAKQEIIKKLTAYEIKGHIFYDEEKKEELNKKDYASLKEEWEKTQKTNWFSRTKQEVIMNLAINKRGEATEQIVQYLKKFYTFKTTRSDDASEIWIYEKGIYKPEGKTYIQETCRTMLELTYTTHLAKNVINKIEADTYIDQDDFFEQQNKHPYIIPVKNGLLNLKTKKLSCFNKNIAFFNKLSMNYKPKAKCETIKQFIKEITKNEEDVQVIQELFGYCLIKDYKYEKAFMFYGSHGRNGKSKLLELLKRLVGVENTASISLEDLEKDSFSMSELHNKMINISADISKNAVNNTGNFKNLTGRDQILAARKFKTRIKFVNYAKMVFAANTLPPINDSNSDAFWLRWVLIEFPHQFLPEKELVENKEAKLQDPQIINKLLDENEMEGLLTWSIEGLDRLEEQKDFSNKATAKQVKYDWMKRSNSVAAFIYEHVVECYDKKILKDSFKKVYINYCKKNRLKVLSDKVIKITLEGELNAGSTRESIFLDNQYKQLRYWDGVEFKNNNLCSFSK